MGRKKIARNTTFPLIFAFSRIATISARKTPTRHSQDTEIDRIPRSLPELTAAKHLYIIIQSGERPAAEHSALAET